MSFNPNIPTIADPILQSYFQLRANFQAINSAFAVNHSSLNGNQDNAGAHTILTLRPQNVDPITATDENALYNKLISAVPELFFMPNNSQAPIQLTYPSLVNDKSNNQYSFIAGPFVIYFGLLPNAPNGFMVNLLPVTALKYVNLAVTNTTSANPLKAKLSAIPINITGNQFTVSHQITSPGPTFPVQIYYFAIGL